jgi:AraC-like DNA-binding protein
MTFVWYDVAPPLKRHINFLYAVQGSMPYQLDGILPTPSTDLKFNFGDAWRVQEHLSGDEASLSPQSWCLGIWTQRHFVEWPEKTDFIGVSFKPGGAYAFLGAPLSELRNRMVPLEALWNNAAELRERLYEATSLERRFSLLEELLLARLADSSDAVLMVQYVAAQIVDRQGSVRIGELCDELGISHKHLITLFNRIVGCPPKQLARLCRFEHVLESLDLGNTVLWTSVAQDSDYFDQAHFTRDFEDFAGLGPSAYLKQRRSVLEESPAHASVPWILPAG